MHADFENRYEILGVLQEILNGVFKVPTCPTSHDIPQPRKYLFTFDHRELTSIVRMIEQGPEWACELAPRSATPIALHGLKVDTHSRRKHPSKHIET